MDLEKFVKKMVRALPAQISRLLEQLENPMLPLVFKQHVKMQSFKQMEPVFPAELAKNSMIKRLNVLSLHVELKRFSAMTVFVKSVPSLQLLCFMKKNNVVQLVSHVMPKEDNTF